MAGGGKAKTPVEVEATAPVGETVDVEWDGHAYKVPASLDDMDLDAVEAFTDGNALQFVRAALGPDQWALLKERGRGRPHRFPEFRERVAVAMGFGGEGESEASSG